ncbi:hypothetical protein, partial [Longispora albida]|uniref:hypothetical protein n=1 Tax=Longispora albida TaxID=203523 RepID=UPI00039C7705
MDDRTREMLDAEVGRQLAAHGQVQPPWRAYPDYERYSIGWRMGNGEWHMMTWGHWWQAAFPGEPERLAFFRAEPPPAEWLDWAAYQIWPDLGFGEAGITRLADHGIGPA